MLIHRYIKKWLIQTHRQHAVTDRQMANTDKDNMLYTHTHAIHTQTTCYTHTQTTCYTLTQTTCKNKHTDNMLYTHTDNMHIHTVHTENVLLIHAEVILHQCRLIYE